MSNTHVYTHVYTCLIHMSTYVCTQGKLMDIQFDSEGHMVGARTINYLLEKSRIAKQAQPTSIQHLNRPTSTHHRQPRRIKH